MTSNMGQKRGRKRKGSRMTMTRPTKTASRGEVMEEPGGAINNGGARLHETAGAEGQD